MKFRNIPRECGLFPAQMVFGHPNALSRQKPVAVAPTEGSTHNTGILDCFQGYDVKHTVMCSITSSKLETKQRH
jgi:hypothetical protein